MNQHPNEVSPERAAAIDEFVSRIPDPQPAKAASGWGERELTEVALQVEETCARLRRTLQSARAHRLIDQLERIAVGE